MSSPVDDPVDSADLAATPQHSPRLTLVTLGVAAVVVLLDQLAKAWVLSSLRDRPPIELLGQWLRLTYVENTGAAFGLGTGFTIVFTCIAVGVIIVIIRTSRRLGSLGWAVALGGLLGGALGNLIDRLTREPGFGRGFVVDFIQVPNFPVWNVADMAIVGSAVLMVILALSGTELDGRASGSGR